jgi:glycosyltransferase involved in cell wall biosynthesis
MKLTIVSNYINHHQIPVAGELYDKLGSNFSFIQTEPMEDDRVKMGWGSEVDDIPYLKLFYKEPDCCRKLIMDSDIVIFGGVEDESYIKPRLNAGKTVIRYSERLYKHGQWKSVSPRGRRKKYEDHTQYADKNVYLLCSGAYVASDFDIVHAYPNKKYAWGYFPMTREYDIDKLICEKNHINSDGNSEIRLLWSGRFIKYKKPEYAIRVANDINKEGISFHLDMVGAGELEEKLKDMVKKYKLTERVTFHGFQPPAKVRSFMEKADIFLFTSNYEEGWGVVLNESMNSGCAVVAGHGIGAVPYLMTHGENGLVYRTGFYREFRDYVLRLCEDDNYRKSLGKNAYNRIIGEWNHKEAALRLYNLCQKLCDGEKFFYDEGILEMAPEISPLGGYRYTHKNH